MISVSDIVKLIEQVPLWKIIKELPKKVNELENRISLLEEKIDVGGGAAMACPKCGNKMAVISESEHGMFGFAGVKTHTMKCEKCQNIATRDFDPGKGYL